MTQVHIDKYVGYGRLVEKNEISEYQNEDYVHKVNYILILFYNHTPIEDKFSNVYVIVVGGSNKTTLLLERETSFQMGQLLENFQRQIEMYSHTKAQSEKQKIST